MNLNVQGINQHLVYNIQITIIQKYRKLKFLSDRLNLMNFIVTN